MLATNIPVSVLHSPMQPPLATSEADFVQILDQHQHLLHKVCRMYARTSEEQNDLFQDMVVQLWRAWPQFRHQCKISTWMYRIALNVAISGLRRKRLPTETLTEQAWNIPDRSEPELPDRLQQLYAALDRLSPVEKSFALLLLEDYNYEEIAAITGLSEAHLRVKIFRIKEKLRSILNPSLQHKQAP